MDQVVKLPEIIMAKKLLCSRHYVLLIVLLAITASILIPIGHDTENNLTLTKMLANRSERKLTIDWQQQKVVEDAIKTGIASYHARSGVALVIDVHSGAIKAMASYSHGGTVESMQDIITPYEPGSVVKPLVIAAALNEGAVGPNYQYYDEDLINIGGRHIVNALNYGPGERSLQDIITFSLNTGAVHILQQLDGSSENDTIQSKWYSYLQNNYGFGTQTTSDFIIRSRATLPDLSWLPDAKARYAQTSFGIGLTVSPLQLAAAFSAVIGDGTLHSPYIYAASANTQKVTRAVSKPTSETVRQLLVHALSKNNPKALRAGYSIGAKSGTAPIADKGGVYQENTNHGTYIGFVGVGAPQLVLFVRLDKPIIDGFASTAAAQVWTNMVQALIDNDLIY